MGDADIIRTVRERFRTFSEREAVWWRGQFLSYRDLYERVDAWKGQLQAAGVQPGTVCSVVGDFSPATMSLFFALMEEACILVPFTCAVHDIAAFEAIASAECRFTFDETDAYVFERFSGVEKKPLLQKMADEGRPGLVVFSSGSTGEPKGIVQDCAHVMNKFRTPRKAWRMILFLMMDHFGGFNTFLSALANGGVAVCIPTHRPEDVCRAIEAAKADLLPATPTFLNLLLASRCDLAYDITSLRLITYGTEMMNTTTLKQLQESFPAVRLKQTYGLSELGVLRSKSEADGSLWLKVGGSEFETKVVDHILWIRGESNMAGYLNAPDPFDKDGWFCTGDEVEERDGYLRFVGRATDIINVGGQKVFPAEVEAVLLEDENVCEAAVFGRPHPLVGQIVAARVSLLREEPLRDVTVRLRKRCAARLEKYKIPIKIEIADGEAQHTERYKKIRG